MSWTHTGMFGLFHAERTYELTPIGRETLIQVTETFTGPLAPVLRRRTPLSGSATALTDFLQAAKSRAELLERTLATRTRPDASAA